MNLDIARTPINDEDIAKISQKLERVDYIFGVSDKDQLNEKEKQFLEDCRRATTDTAVRIRRSIFLIELMA